MTQTASSFPAAAASCLRRIAAARPEGPAPTTTTSYSICSRCASDTDLPLLRQALLSAPATIKDRGENGSAANSLPADSRDRLW